MSKNLQSPLHLELVLRQGQTGDEHGWGGVLCEQEVVRSGLHLRMNLAARPHKGEAVGRLSRESRWRV